jgi:1,4-alpha-glucan branching enzyme
MGSASGHRALTRLPKSRLLEIGRSLGLCRLEGLNRAELIDLLQRANPDAPDEDVGAPSEDATAAETKTANGTMRPEASPPPAFRLDDRLTLLLRDSGSFYAYWQLSDEQLAGESEGENQLLLRLHDVGGASREFAIEPWARSWVLPIPSGGSDYQGELGYRQRNGKWRGLLRSNQVQTPLTSPDDSARERVFAQPGPAGPVLAAPRQRSDAVAEERMPATGRVPRRVAAGALPLPSEEQAAPLKIEHALAMLTELSPQLQARLAVFRNLPFAKGTEPSVTPDAAPEAEITPDTMSETAEQLLDIAAELLSTPFGPGPTFSKEAFAKGDVPPALVQLLKQSGLHWPHLMASEDGWPQVVAALGLDSSIQSGGFRVSFVDEEGAPQDGPLSWRSKRDTAAIGAGHLAFVLHAHLPFVRHPEHDVFLEEDWLFEAITETYIPLLQMLEQLAARDIPVQLTIALSPPLLSMLGDELLRDRYERHLGWLIAFAQREQNEGDLHQRRLAAHYLERLRSVQTMYRELDRDLAGAFARWQKRGVLDLMTCAATHGLLSVLQPRQAVWAQLASAVAFHTEVIGQAPSGIWLPECGYQPGLEYLLAKAGLRYFVVEKHALTLARPAADYGVKRPVYCTDARLGVAAFGRDPLSAEQVWSRQTGYPGDPRYREFHRDRGFEASEESLGSLVLPDGTRRPVGLKYHRISETTSDEKDWYYPNRALARTQEHARHFVQARIADLGADSGAPLGPADLVVAPYDAELFGHWWYEGPSFLKHVAELCHQHADAPKMTHLRGYLDAHAEHQVVEVAPSTWGEGGYHATWVDQSNAWVYADLEQAAQRLCALCRRHQQTTDPLVERALTQAVRELFLAQASDWTFLIRAGTAQGYAKARLEQHLAACFALLDQIDGTDGASIDGGALAELEARDNLFAELDFRIYAADI